jgi:hypothetical protein
MPGSTKSCVYAHGLVAPPTPAGVLSSERVGTLLQRKLAGAAKSSRRFHNSIHGTLVRLPNAVCGLMWNWYTLQGQVWKKWQPLAALAGGSGAAVRMQMIP